MKQKKIGFIGLGLIGGSIAKAVRRYYPDYEIVAFDKNRETLALATQESIINVACTSIDDNFRGCNYIFLCAPVAFNTAYLKQMMPYLHDDMILLVESMQHDKPEEREDYYKRIKDMERVKSSTSFSQSKGFLLFGFFRL